MATQSKIDQIKQASAMAEIVYAAFQTHFKCVFSPQIKAAGLDPDAAAAKHWNDNPDAKTLWDGLIKAVVVNLSEAQRKGLIPKLQVEAPAPLVGLGGPPTGRPVDTSPAGLAARIGAALAQDGPRAPGTPPGLAIGRATDDDDGA